MTAQFDESLEEVKVENTVSSMMGTVISSSSSCFNSSSVTTIEETVATSNGLTSHEVFRRKITRTNGSRTLITCMIALDFDTFLPPFLTLFHIKLDFFLKLILSFLIFFLLAGCYSGPSTPGCQIRLVHSGRSSIR